MISGRRSTSGWEAHDGGRICDAGQGRTAVGGRTEAGGGTEGGRRMRDWRADGGRGRGMSSRRGGEADASEGGRWRPALGRGGREGA